MKLKKIEVSADRSNGRPLLTVSKTGKFSLSPAMREKVGYSEGIKINFHQDEDSPKDWYMSFENEGIDLREVTAGKYTAVFIQKSALAAQIRKVFNSEDSMTFIVGAATELEGVNYWPMLHSK